MFETYIVTGASRGIGAEFISQILKDPRNHAHALTRSASPSGQLAELKKKYGKRLDIHQVDVTNDSSVRDFVGQLPKTFSFQVLINNAGTYDVQGDGDFDTLNLKAVEDTFKVNTVSAMRMTQGLLPWLRSNKYFKIINITSLMGSIADNQSGGAYAYRISKAALNMFSKGLAQDFPNVISIALHPGWVKTEMGGEEAPTSVEESVSGMLKVINNLQKSDSGKLYDYEGEELPW